MADIPISPDAGQLVTTRFRPTHLITRHFAARSGVARSGCARSGYTSADITWFEDWTEVRVNGIDVTDVVGWDEFVVTEALGSEPSTCTCQFVGLPSEVPEWGKSLTVWLGGTDTGVPLFGGVITRTEIEIVKASDETERLIYTVEAQDWRYMLNRTALVTGVYENQGVNTIVRRIVNDFTDSASGFTVGYVPSALGSLSRIEFNGTLVSEAISQVAEAAGAVWVVEGSKRITLFTPTETTETTTDRLGDDAGITYSAPEARHVWSDILLARDAAEYANRVRVAGGSTVLTADAGQGATSVDVENLALFNGHGGTADTVVAINGDEMEVTLSTTRTTQGEGTLTLNDPLVRDVHIGDTATMVYYAEQTADQADLSTRFGGGQSGVVMGVSIQDDRLTNGSDLIQFANSLVDSLYLGVDGVTFTVREDSRFSYQGVAFNLDKIRPGRMMNFSRSEWSSAATIANEQTLGARVRLAMRSVVTRFFARRPENGNPTYEKRVHASRLGQPLSAILIRALDHSKPAI